MSTNDRMPVYDPTCTPCVLQLGHAHPDGRAPMWVCLHCHNAEHVHCDPDRQFCTCGCGVKETP